MSLRLHIVRNLDVTVMELSGRVTLGEGSITYRDAVREALWNGHRKLALDYSEITYQDSSGNGELVSAFTTVRNSGGELVLFDLTKRIHDMFLITKLYAIFHIYDSLGDALAYFDSNRKPEINVTEHRYHHVAVLGIEGTLSEAFSASKVTSATQLAMDAGAESVVLLCPQVLDVDSSGAESLLAARRYVRERGGDLVLAGVEDHLLSAISKVGILGEVPMYKTIDDALGTLGLKVSRNGLRYEVVRAN
jgi:anti-sigma B factor antagonist